MMPVMLSHRYRWDEMSLSSPISSRSISDYSDVQFQIGRIASAESWFSTLFLNIFSRLDFDSEIRFQRHPISNQTLNVLLSVGSKSDSDFGSDVWDIWFQKKIENMGFPSNNPFTWTFPLPSSHFLPTYFFLFFHYTADIFLGSTFLYFSTS